MTAAPIEGTIAGMGYETLTARRIAGSLGAEIEGVDLSKPLEERQFGELNDALLSHQVLFLRGQQAMDEAAHLDLAGRFGALSVYPIVKVLGGDQALETIEDSEESPPGADAWHTDVTWIERPPKVGVLTALVIPEYGGDTMWASTTAAYEALSPVMRELISGLSVRHGLAEGFWSRVRGKLGEELCERVQAQIEPEVVHPLVRTHPETGRRALFVAGHFMLGIQGMEPAESELLLDFLMRHATQERFQLRWRWREGDVALWDERCTLHHALPDHYPQHRKMRRCTVDGDRPS
jgi:taurine dioxygenase